ncbi:MAG: hypothetical protein H0V04_04190 [Chloroflexi bacterium]|nr:hypothetical protein [Chloroflexota bacterium]
MDRTDHINATIRQLPPGPGRRGYAGRGVEPPARGRMAVWDGDRYLLITEAFADAIQLRRLRDARPSLGTPPPD